MKSLLPAVAVLFAVTPLAGLTINISHQDIDRALVIARASEPERAQFHTRYVKTLNTPFVERVEVVSEFRRVVLLAEDQRARGDRFFVYSTTRAADALQVFRRRVSIIARVRFHPLNNYVSVPAVAIAMAGNDRALVGVKLDPIYAFAPSEPATPQFVPLAGAVVEGSFEAEAIGQAIREFVVSMDGRELARVSFDFAAIE
jgi:hypothetical protein